MWAGGKKLLVPVSKALMLLQEWRKADLLPAERRAVTSQSQVMPIRGKGRGEASILLIPSFAASHRNAHSPPKPFFSPGGFV